VRQGGYLRRRLPLAWKYIINQEEHYVEIEFAKRNPEGRSAGLQDCRLQDYKTTGLQDWDETTGLLD